MPKLQAPANNSSRKFVILDVISFLLTSGQIVCCQVGLHGTLEGFSARAGNLDFWHHLDLTRKRWGTKIHPAVVLTVK